AQGHGGPAAAEELLEHELRIDHERLFAIVRAGVEADAMCRIDAIRRFDGALLTADDLVCEGARLMDFDPAGAQDQIAVAVEGDAVDAVEIDGNFSCVTAGGDVEVVLEVLLVSAEDDIDARIRIPPLAAAE